ncbi:putative olfactory receptor 5AK3 [Thalassophryne amazonica]|uniref:putative olfactory receptor 5AK3 n=1 Tax=Thalassophryne amazonica TaxID=390379 RepID=UPI0014725376|nr:putative olfactory receptor 5AK3 [Thalassophryne amazonica]
MDNVSVKVFVLSGFNETLKHRIVLFSVTLICYCAILLLNVSLVMIIILDKNLHEPMYILLCAYCLNTCYGTTDFYPKFLWDLLSPVHLISYSGCLIQALVMYSFACSELSILALMSYDRYLAICRPLRYHSIMTKKRLFHFMVFIRIVPAIIFRIDMFLTLRMKLCSSNISRLYCLNRVIVQLACSSSDKMIINVVYVAIIIYFFHGLFIVWSYMYLIKTCISSLENRTKFLQTCVPHLTSLFIFIVTVLFDYMYIRFGSKDLPQAFQNFVAIEFLVIPPIMNPLIYGFNLANIRKRIQNLTRLKY